MHATEFTAGMNLDRVSSRIQVWACITLLLLSCKAAPIPVTDAQCAQYCDDVLGCPSASGLYSSLYTTKESCLGLCAMIDGGSSEDRNANTIGCREQLLQLREGNCQGAGPGGFGICGSDCESYCTLLHRICPDSFSADFPPSLGDPEHVCQLTCGSLITEAAYTVDDPTVSAADSLQCRLWHLAAATVDGAGHCEFAQFHENKQCADDPSGPHFCLHFCSVNGAACGSAAYESERACVGVCLALPAGMPDDQTGNTRACRLWHSYSAATLPAAHCTYTTAGGDGHCGTDNCQSYCILVNSENFKNTCRVEAPLIPSLGDCNSKCKTLAGAGANEWGSVDGGAGTVQCLLRHVGRALGPFASVDGGPSECEMALGLAECQ